MYIYHLRPHATPSHQLTIDSACRLPRSVLATWRSQCRSARDWLMKTWQTALEFGWPVEKPTSLKFFGHVTSRNKIEKITYRTWWQWWCVLYYILSTVFTRCNPCSNKRSRIGGLKRTLAVGCVFPTAILPQYPRCARFYCFNVREKTGQTHRQTDTGPMLYA